MNKITTVNGIIRNIKGEILVVQDDKGFWLLPGGIMEGDESDQETLSRELAEELQVELIQAKLVGYFDYERAFTVDRPLQMRVYLAEIKGIPKPANEIANILWLNKENYKQGQSFPKMWWDKIFTDLL
ncbi:MAG: NUDIX domain-containing protein [bacterium]